MSSKSLLHNLTLEGKNGLASWPQRHEPLQQNSSRLWSELSAPSAPAPGRAPTPCTTEKMELIQNAKQAEEAKRYDDMGTYVKAAAGPPGGSSPAWSRRPDTSDKKLPLIKDHQEKVESELRSTCTTVLKVLAKYLIANATDLESKVFYLEMKGDHFRYPTEVARGDER
ncbi:14-3-3 protein theta [Tupaia chinensis]|uniref:14-3-3 protein theta n=1 Tax=Tupaia chinensis TaxID=246437 RepID=L9KF74_TUPCH|nr:14-3-3 protein theta [Tupaia chinensis]